ncbi:sam domain containing protein [Niveomyces insectorum RCEF 264]|uniref:Sam domain containing protein n=1 Tax=Niveomyces insectorum RCEF 264 TaxID=1081102 RepID=A0A167RD09_9HYPO|nr:sam domain containing protein [Niveomyces insectorum RCEF 264]
MAEDVSMDDASLGDDGSEGERGNRARPDDVVYGGGGLELDNDADSNEDDAAELSEADSDYLELQADIARLDASRQAFLSEHLGPEYKAGGGGGGGGASTAPRRRRGPRKAAAPSAEVKFRLQQAHQLFMDHRYEDALDTLHEIIRMNAETHAAWSLLASINEDLGRRDDAIMAKVFAAHLEPKHVAGWLSTADYALAEADEDEQRENGVRRGEREGGAEAGEKNDDEVDDDDEDAQDRRQQRRLHNLQIARLCYSGALRADKDNIAARLGKANVCLEFGQATNAATEYVRVLKRRPLALQVIRNLAEASYDSAHGAATIEAAIAAYRTAIAYLQSRSTRASHSWYQPFLVLDEDEQFTWMDVTIYVELFAAVARFDDAVAALKRLARWLLGRGGPDEAYWDDHAADGHNDNDAEWDRYDEPRRRRVDGFQPGRYPPSAYGDGLPIDLRAKLAIYRLKLGHEEEALEHLSWIDPQDAGTTEAMRMFRHLLKDVGFELFEVKRYELALQYLELYRALNRAAAAEEHNFYEAGAAASEFAENSAAARDDDAEALVLQGKCNLELHDHAAAEESFLAAIEADEENIAARFELAKMYETAHEKEQAFILVNEALSLEAAQQQRQKQQKKEMGALDEQGQGRPPAAAAAAAERHGTATETAGAPAGKRPRGHAASLETATYRVFLDSEGKVVRRRRKDRKRPVRRSTRGGGGTAEQKRAQRRAKANAGGRAGVGSEAEEDDVEGADSGGDAIGRPYRPRRTLRGHARRFFASPAEQAAFEATTSSRLRARYQLCQDVKARADAGDPDAAAQWMDAAKELIDDFRSFREFYSWDKYVQFLGYNNFLHDRTHGAEQPATAAAAAAAGTGAQHSSDLTALAERLQQNLVPGGDAEPATTGAGAVIGAADADRNVPTARRDYRGIPFDDWLALFLEYALRLAHAGRTAEAYAVCQAAHDSTVYRQNDSAFLIHLTWAACALRASDEPTCVAVARYFMRARPFTTDCYRLFTTLCRVCRAPSVWFSASPAQKYILRQIRQRDAQLFKQHGGGTDAAAAQLDVCLLVVYGHILFASTSFHYALNYYQRALAVDPDNPVISLCIGLSYVHWALKRQAENRQYLLTQGLTFLYRYATNRLNAATPDGGPPDVHARREAYYNLGRTYHLLGLHALAAEFYNKVLDEEGEAAAGPAGPACDPYHSQHHEMGQYCPDLRTEAAYNLRTYYLLAGNQAAAMNVTRTYLVM